MQRLSGHGWSLSNAARGGRRKLRRKAMLKITRDHLRRKSDRQLVALFNSLNSEIAAYQPASPELGNAQSLLAMIAQEQAARNFCP